MKRILAITAIAIAGVLGLAVLGIAALLYSSPGRAFIIAKAEPAIAAVTGGDARIGTIKGAPPGHIIVENVILSESGEVWANVDRLDLRWRPLALISGKIDVNSLVIDGGSILREPPQKPEDPEKKKEPFSIKLPDGLPEITIRKLEINDFRSELGGVTARLDGGGALAMGGRAISTNLKLTSANDADTIDLAIDIAPGADRIYIDATIAAAQDGVVAAFADLGGPLFIEIDTDSPSKEAAISINALAGAYGKLDATLLANLENLVSINADGTFVAGTRLAEIPELAEPVRFNIYLQDEKSGGRITINRLLTAVGALAGDVVWKGDRANSNSLTADLRATLNDNYRTDIQNFLGRDITLATTLQRQPEDYALSLRVRGGDVDAEIANGTTDLKSKISGDLIATLAARDDFPPKPARITTKFAVDLEETASLRTIKINIGEQFSAAGDGDYNFTDESVRFEGDVDAAPEFVTAFVPSMIPQGRVVATIDAAGVADRFTLTANAETPAILIGENRAPALTANVALSGLPTLPSGEIKAKAKKGPGALSATLRSSANGRIAAPALSYTGPGFNLKGSGAFTPDTQNGEIDLVYQGGSNAQPWPGLVVAGDFTAKGTFAREGEQTNLLVRAQALRIAEIALQNLALQASGPPSAIDTTLSASEISTASGTVITKFASAATINAKEDIVVRLTQLNAALLDNTLRLIEPGTITIADGASVGNLRLGWSSRGLIAVDGVFSPTQWRGDFALTDINLPQTDGRISAQLALDTNATTPATGSYLLTSLISETEATISGKMNWDGDALLLTSVPDKDALEMRLSLPAKLQKTPSISVTTDGPLDGFIRYDGAIEPFAAFLPPDLQTLEGFLTVDFRVVGTTQSPELSGVAELTDAAYTELRSGLSLDGLHTRAEATYSQSGSTLTFSGGGHGGGQSGADTIIIGGDMTLSDTSRADITIELKNAEFSAHPVTNVRADGKIEIAGSLDAITTKGAIDVLELNAEIITPESTGLVPIEVVNLDETLNDPDPFGSNRQQASFDLDLSITADDRIFVRGRGLESEWRADIRAVTQRGEIIILGDMRLRKGTLDFSGRRFEVRTGNIAFDRLSTNNPLLDIIAEFETDEGVTAAIEISGRATTPAIELTSTPTLPQEDIMALMLFGKQASALTAFESLQAAQALASLGGIGPFGGSGGFTGSLRQATGLDLLNFDVDPENGGGSLTVGKYVADGLFVSATQDAQGTGGAVIVEYDITDNISVETEIRQDGDQTVSANWKKDF